MRVSIVLLLATALFAERTPAERLPWAKATERFAGLEVEVKQQDGKRFRGSWVAEESDSCTLKTKSGMRKLSRSKIESIHAMRRQSRGRVIGAIGGYLLGAGLVVLITGSGEGAQGLPGLLMAALSGLGFWAGREIDRDRRRFELY